MKLFPLLFAALLPIAAIACSDTNGEQTEADATKAEDVFAKTLALPISIKVPMSTIFSRYAAGQADPPEPAADGGAPAEATFSERGKLTVEFGGAKKELDVRVFVRGESSRRDCPFTKLKLEFTSKDQLKGTPFKGHSKIRLNTHCGPGDVNARSGMGRVMNGVGPVREELSYRLIRTAGVATYLTRVASVRYEDTAANSTLETFGMLMETGDDAAQRFAKEGLIDAEKGQYLEQNSGNANGTPTPLNQAQLVVSEVLAGNRDWAGTHNSDSFGVIGEPTLLRIPQDFDLTAITLGDPNSQWANAVSEASAGLENADVAKQFFNKKADMEAVLATAEKDAIEAKAVPEGDGSVTTDPGFVEAHRRLAELFTLPQFNAFR